MCLIACVSMLDHVNHLDHGVPSFIFEEFPDSFDRCPTVDIDGVAHHLQARNNRTCKQNVFYLLDILSATRAIFASQSR